jgi:NtrC-family two-component system response regulator AlgB
MRILIVDDESSIRKTMVMAVEAEGHDADSVDSGFLALRKLAEESYDLIFLDVRLGREDGLEVLKQIQKVAPRTEVVVFTAHASIETAVEAMRRGAFDYIPKPFTPEYLRQVIQRVTKARRLEGRVAELETRISQTTPETDLTTRDPMLKSVYETAFRAAATPATILILGESGTGKSVLARAIHQQSLRKEQPFITVSCPSLSRELLESELFGHVKGSFTGAVGDTWGKVAAADKGTLFLDEIGELPLEIQPKLLRLLQEKEYERVGESKPRRADVRIIAATNRNLAQSVKDGTFREDLFYRLNVIGLRMPPLRERQQDLLAIANNYLRFFAEQSARKVEGFSPEATASLQRYGWPGNLRELRNAIERAVILCNGEQVEAGDLPETFSPAADSQVDLGSKATLEELEREHIRLILAQSPSFDSAAKVLGIDPATLYRKRKKLAL